MSQLYHNYAPVATYMYTTSMKNDTKQTVIHNDIIFDRYFIYQVLDKRNLLENNVQWNIKIIQVQEIKH